MIMYNLANFHSTLATCKDEDVHFISSDGFVLPMHGLIASINSFPTMYALIQEKRTVPGKVVDLVVPFDGQTMWRVVSFIYTETYDDDDAELNVDRVTVPLIRSTGPAEESSSMDVDTLTSGFNKLYVSQRTCESAAFLKAWANLQVYTAAVNWNMDRLIVESSTRFANLVAGSSADDGFVDFVDAVFKYVADPTQQLYEILVQECASSHAVLSNKDEFLNVIQKNGLLGRLLFEKLSSSISDGLLASSNNEDNAVVAIDDQSSIAGLDARILELENELSARDEYVSRLEADNEQKSIECNALQSKHARVLNDYDSLDDDFADARSALDKLAANHAVLQAKHDSMSNLNKTLTEQVNKHRAGQPQTTDLVVAMREQHSLAQAKLETELKETKSQLKTKQQELDRIKGQNSQDRRSVQEFGSLNRQIDQINNIIAVDQRPASRAATGNARDKVLSSSAVVNAGGPETFVERMRRERAAAAGISGPPSDVAPPASMPLVQRPMPQAVQQPAVNGSSRPAASNAAPHVAATNGAPHPTAPHGITNPAAPNGTTNRPNQPTNQADDVHALLAQRDEQIRILQRDLNFTRNQLSDARNGPGSAVQPQPNNTAAGNTAAGNTGVANNTTATSNNGVANNNGPTNNGGINTAWFGANNAGANGQAGRQREGTQFYTPPTASRCKKILAVLRQIGAEHHTCRDCMAKFFGQIRETVDSKGIEYLKLECTKCEDEQVRLPV